MLKRKHLNRVGEFIGQAEPSSNFTDIVVRPKASMHMGSWGASGPPDIVLRQDADPDVSQAKNSCAGDSLLHTRLVIPSPSVRSCLAACTAFLPPRFVTGFGICVCVLVLFKLG